MPTLPWSAIDTVLLDMDGTLLDLHFDNHFWLEHLPQRYAERNGLSRTEADAVLEPLFREHAGQLNWYCLISGAGNWTCRSANSSTRWRT